MDPKNCVKTPTRNQTDTTGSITPSDTHSQRYPPDIWNTQNTQKDTPLHPIVDSIRSVTSNLYKALVEIIKPLLGTSQHHCKNSKQLDKN